MNHDELSDAEYEAAIEHAGRLALIHRYGPSADEVAEFPRWKKAACRLLPHGQRWRLSWAAGPIRDMRARLGR